MESTMNPILSAIAAGVIQRPQQTSAKADVLSTDERIQLFCDSAKGTVTLFLGAAISTFKPTQLPMWNQFIELIWTSALWVGLQDLPDRQEIMLSFMEVFNKVKALVPNYLVTEVVSRRLGMQYLDLLEAFEAQRLAADASELWALNEIHVWAATSLMTGSVAAIVTTNFDNYLEKALEVANANYYQITGDVHEDGREISARLQYASSTQKLVLIVNGPKSFAFVRSVMPQFGRGEVTFLLKLHGSCYEPPTCIDTRLQRSQGLPSCSTDILDILLLRSTLLVAGFSGSDMNDNLDYLRFLSNRNHARVIWLEPPGSHRETSLRNLVKVLDLQIQSPVGLCLTPGYFTGKKVSAEDEAPEFAKKVLQWAENLGADWCRLVTIDLMKLFQSRASEQLPTYLLQRLNHGEIPRQDWNLLLNTMDLLDQQDQVAPAKICNKTRVLLESITAPESSSSTQNPNSLCDVLNNCLRELSTQHVTLESTLLEEHPKPHAQSWVLSSLSGLVLLCGDQLEAAIKSLEISAGLAWLVGEYENYALIRNIITKIESEQQSSQLAEPDFETGTNNPTPCVAFTPAMDNVSSKSNRYGVPPAVFIRALLHRSILFSDGMAIPSNVMTSSTVFVDEVLFQGELDTLNESIAHHLYPLIPSTLKKVSNKFTSYVTSRRLGYIQEPVDPKHIQKLDEYFDRSENQQRVLYYDEESGSENYGRLFRTQLDEDHAMSTMNHLERMWHYTTPSISRQLSREAGVSLSSIQPMSATQETAEDLVQVLRRLGESLPDKIYRSSLYKFADLFDSKSEPEAFLKDLKSGLSEEAQSELMAGRNRIVQKPWYYGPYCHELFDNPYRCNISFNQAAVSNMHTLVFLEEDEVSSWKLMSDIYESTDIKVQLHVTSRSIAAEHKCSSLLLSQAPNALLLQARQALHPIRAKFAANLELSGEDADIIRTVMSRFESRSLRLPEVEITELVRIESNTLLECMQKLLSKCVFLVRKGPPLDPMYEEAQLTIPGLHALRRY